MLRSDSFNGKGGKVTMGGYSEQMVIESRFSAAFTGKMT